MTFMTSVTTVRVLTRPRSGVRLSLWIEGLVLGAGGPREGEAGDDGRDDRDAPEETGKRGAAAQRGELVSLQLALWPE